MTRSNTELARLGFDAVTHGDFDALADLLDADVKWHGGNPADGCQNRDQTLGWMRSGPRRRQGPLPQLIDVVGAGERVAVIMQPAPTAEDPAPQRTANLATFRDGKVIEMIHFDDAADALAALGPAD